MKNKIRVAAQKRVTQLSNPQVGRCLEKLHGHMDILKLRELNDKYSREIILSSHSLKTTLEIFMVQVSAQ